ncbi:MAG TPA: histidine--tRNA ligase [Nitrospirales bacterium]|nr:histidine--tRNA ligase [Nitrospirales bacterium]HIO22015.1 histidine--tRNA ligase [Nitrospirales bacterium]
MIKAIKGVKDILPTDVSVWQKIESEARDVFRRYGYQEIRIPVFEQTELFARSIGADTDIVGKEMYTFPDRDGTSLTLRPEGTASVVRAYIEHSLHQHARTWKLFYLGPMFRHERPQAGRLRQFHQAGVEVFGYSEPHVDVEVIALLHRYFMQLGVPTFRTDLNSLGDAACRPAYLEMLKGFLNKIEDRLCENCKRRAQTNPLRVLDCKVKSCKAVLTDAPIMLDHLCEDCRTHFDVVKAGLDKLDIPYSLNSRLVRGLDYYNRTAFEVISTNLGAQDAVAAGGRYDGLVKALGGPAIPGIGFAIGLERLVLLVKETIHSASNVDVFIAALGENATSAMLPVLDRLRTQGVAADMDYAGGSLKSQMKQADRSGARLTVIVGDDELEKKSVVVRDMQTKDQQDVVLADLVATLITRCAEMRA